MEDSQSIHFIGEYVRLAEIAVVHVLGNVEDEGCFLKLELLEEQTP